MANINKSGMITLVERAFAVKDSDKKYSMTIDDHKLICGVLDAHLESMDIKFLEYKKELLGDVVKVMEDQWERVLKIELGKFMDERLVDFGKKRDNKILKWFIVSGFIILIISVAIGLAINIWYHNHFLISPILSIFR
jgi:hypothetical protein